MKLRRLEIGNFRGITQLDLKLTDTTVIIGENNIGKTAILDALKFALRDVRARKGCEFDAYDFHLNDANAKPADAPAIGIRLTFSEDTVGEWGDALTGRLTRAKIGQVDANGLASVFLKVSARYDPTTRDFVQDWQFQNASGDNLPNIGEAALSTLRGIVSYYYLAALRDAAKHFDPKGLFWRPFLKESQLTIEKRTEIEGQLKALNDLIVSSHASFEQVAAKLKEVKDVVAIPGADDMVSIDAVPGRLFDMLSKAQVNMNTATGAKVPIGRHGDGTQSLSVLMLFNAFLHAWSSGAAVVALEEPEAHLHPSAIRSLWKLIERVAGQKVVSTHSGDILSVVPAESIVRLHKRAGMVVSSRYADIDLNPQEKRQFNFHIRRDRGELLFARCWILGEGETDATLVTETANLLGKDLEHAGVRFVTYQTGVSVEPCLKVGNGLGIHWVVLTDNDAQGADDRATVRRHLNGRPEAEHLFVMPEAKIEEYLCVNGFSDVYFNMLSDHPRRLITVPSDDPGYGMQVANALPRKFPKVQAAHNVVAAMRAGTHPVPQLLKDVVEAALKLAV